MITALPEGLRGAVDATIEATCPHQTACNGCRIWVEKIVIDFLNAALDTGVAQSKLMSFRNGDWSRCLVLKLGPANASA